MVRDQGARDPLSNPPFSTIGVAIEQVDGIVVGSITVVVIVATVLGNGVAVRIHEQALLSLEGANVPVAKSRLTLAEAAVVLQRY